MTWGLRPQGPTPSTTQRAFCVNGLALGTDSDVVRDHYGSFDGATSSSQVGGEWRLNHYGPFADLIMTPEKTGNELYLVTFATGTQLEEKQRVVLRQGDTLERAEKLLGSPDQSNVVDSGLRRLHYRTAEGDLTVWVRGKSTLEYFSVSRERRE